MKSELTDFIRIENSYGLKQRWLYECHFTTKFISDRSCGLAAAANVILYEAKKINHPLYENVNSIKSAAQVMADLEQIIKPRIWGISRESRLEKGVRIYAKERGLSLHMIKKKKNQSPMCFCYEELEKKCVPLLLTYYSKERSLRFHWVSITGIDGEKVIVSNWGQRREYTWTQMFSKHTIYQALIVFEGEI